jgi:phage gpG-like protein
MNNNISNNMRKIAAAVKNYRDAVFPGMAGKKALRFIDGNFRKQSWEGVPWKRRRGGKRNNGRALLIDKGILRRGTNMRTTSGAVTVFNYVKYAKAHNTGFNGTVAIKAYKRNLFGKYKTSSLKTKKSSLTKQLKGNTDVKAHNRQMRLPRRQFMPTAERPSPTLNKEVQREVQLQMLKILKQ